MFVAVRVHWEALYILKTEAEGSVWFRKVESIPPTGVRMSLGWVQGQSLDFGLSLRRAFVRRTVVG